MKVKVIRVKLMWSVQPRSRAVFSSSVFSSYLQQRHAGSKKNCWKKFSIFFSRVTAKQIGLFTGHRVVTFRISPSEMCTDHGSLSVCLSLAAFPRYRMYLDVAWRKVRGCPLLVHYWADLQ